MANIQRLVSEIITGLRERQFADLAGATVDVSVPLREQFVNEVIAAGVAEKRAPVRYVRLSFRGGNRVGIEVDPKMPFVPNLRINLDVQDVVDCSQDPTLRLRVAPDSFSTALILQGANLFKMPPGIQFNQSQISLHLPTLLKSQDMGDFIPLLRFIMISGQPGLLTVRIHLAVPNT